ncbi:hypothetical protein [Staphylococcus hominis]|uniref:hypothetical protein n=1 Tax=Staphylococcus hominis TaxID=1290 RepID=UPI00066E3A09|nr:hypothetical protein [Staphylococcus hominis]
MTKGNKLTIIYVEGETDEIFLDFYLENLIDDTNTNIQIVYGDVYSEIKDKGIKATIGDKVKAFLKEQKLREEDVESIYHLIDIDGVYLKEDSIQANNKVNVLTYKSDKIEVKDSKHKRNIIDRNKRKKTQINKMIKSKVINTEYKLFYNSCNLEHVLINQLNLSKDEKVNNIQSLMVKYETSEDLEEAINSAFAIQNINGNVDSCFDKSWEILKNNDSEILRLSNINILKEFLVGKLILNN